MMEFSVPDMSCGHCTAAIEKSVKAVDPAAAVDCDLGAHKVRVDSTLSAERLGQAIRDAGYEAQHLDA